MNLECLSSGGLHYPHKGGPQSWASSRCSEHLFVWLFRQKCLCQFPGNRRLLRASCLLHLLGHLQTSLLLRLLRVGVVLRFQANQVRRVPVNDEFPRCVFQRETDLIENSAEFLQRQDSQCIGGNCHDTLGTLLGAETRCELQALVGQRGQVEAILIVIRQPRSAAHRQHRLVALHLYAKELDRARAEITSSRVRQVPGDWVEYCSQQYAVLKTYKKKQFIQLIIIRCL